MNTYRLRIPAISLAWKYIDAESADDAIDIIVSKINSDTIDYSDKSVWQVEIVKASEE